MKKKMSMSQGTGSDVSDIGGALAHVAQTEGARMPSSKKMATNDPKTVAGYTSLGKFKMPKNDPQNRGEGY
jgi:hypothetical protein